MIGHRLPKRPAEERPAARDDSPPDPNGYYGRVLTDPEFLRALARDPWADTDETGDAA